MGLYANNKQSNKNVIFVSSAVDKTRCVNDSVPRALSNRVPMLENVRPINNTENIPTEKKLEKIGRHISPCNTNSKTLLNV